MGIEHKVAEIIERYKAIEYVSETEEPLYLLSKFHEGICNVNNQSYSMKDYAWNMYHLIRAHEKIISDLHSQSDNYQN